MDCRRRVPRMRIQPEARPVEKSPNRRSHGEVLAIGGARISAARPIGLGRRRSAYSVAGSAMPDSR